MKLYFITIILVIFISSCNSNESDSTKNAAPSEEVKRENKIGDDPHEGVNMHMDTMLRHVDHLAEVTDIEYGVDRVPASLYDGNKIIEAVKWKDSLGVNLLFITLSEERSQFGENRIRELFAYQYILEEPRPRFLWKIYDFVKDCPFDITLAYMDKSLTVTDLNDNGIAETTFLYKLSCRSDVSPDDMKLIMHEGFKKFAIRGSMILKINDEEPTKGEMNLDVSFEDAQRVLRNYAIGQWDKFNKEFVGEKYDK
ncbi:MAG: hypothetical protein JSS91_04655 [Bacteroidetes bacterium]|nr:hypothetical protein [Bacteroidota bacterium]